jgi:CRP-like cAMP-binding protein
VDDHPRTLVRVGILAALGEEDRAAIERRCRWRLYAAGDRIIERGSASREIYFIGRGAVDIVETTPSGRGIVFATLGAGQHFGELSAIDGEPRSASVVAAEDSMIAALPTAAFVELLERRGDVALAVLRHLARMVRSGDARIVELTTLGAAQRVYAELLRLARPDPNVAARWIVHPLPALRVIASRIGTTRETVARALGRLYASGLASRKGRSLYVPDRAGLERHLGVPASQPPHD